MKRIDLLIATAVVVFGFMFLTVGLTVAKPKDIPATPVTPPTLTPTLTPTPTESPEPTPTLTPTPTPQAEEGKGKATGGVKAKEGDANIQLNFNAQSKGGVKGNVKYVNSNGDKFQGNVNVCFNGDGNEAAFAGTVKNGNVDEGYFLVEVRDNGEGKNKSEPDRFRVTLFENAPVCTLSHVYPAGVTKGNIQVQ